MTKEIPLKSPADTYQPPANPATLDVAGFTKLVDHTLLKPEATRADVVALLRQAADLGTYSACVSPSMLPLSADELPDGLAIACVCGFPSGAHVPTVKAREAAEAARFGASEIDMVVNLAAVREHDYAAVEEEIRMVVDAVHKVSQAQAVAQFDQGATDVPTRRLVKVIIESAVLTDEEIVACCRAAEAAGADYVKTSTGFHPAGGASVEAVGLMRETVGERLGVKASGGIRDRKTAIAMLEAGASRLGLSGTASIIAEFPA